VPPNLKPLAAIGLPLMQEDPSIGDNIRRDISPSAVRSRSTSFSSGTSTPGSGTWWRGHLPQRDCRPLLAVRRRLPEQFVPFHKMVLEQVRAQLGYGASGGVELAGRGFQAQKCAPPSRRQSVAAFCSLQDAFQGCETDDDGRISQIASWRDDVRFLQ
jgi:hypothetical protein